MRDLEKIHALKFPDRIDRYNNDHEENRQPWHTTVTPLQMLAEILDAVANVRVIDDVGVTHGYVPPPVNKDSDHVLPGVQIVTLWHEIHDEEEDRWVNRPYATFTFITDPEDNLWRGNG
ncbi:hypothetical protein SEA_SCOOBYDOOBYDOO_38 [Mycobacterium phage ScoobyDoobyDoo]|nr:hypothetical protein SEA_SCOOBYDOOBYDOO_38 [Mycobacterium phage ScoobyDoobyDoo]